MPHVVLLGDSIFDNAAYVAGGPDVVAQLRDALPEGWEGTLAAVDGATVADVPRQLARVPPGATHLVLSAGGNDALGHSEILGRPARSVAAALGLLSEVAAAFEARYRALAGALAARGLPLTLCTIYNGNFPDPLYQRVAGTALTAFNDAILRAAFAGGHGVIELRLVCAAPADYANPIEPSVVGGAKIARAVARAVGALGGGLPPSRVVAG